MIEILNKIFNEIEDDFEINEEFSSTIINKLELTDIEKEELISTPDEKINKFLKEKELLSDLRIKYFKGLTFIKNSLSVEKFEKEHQEDSKEKEFKELISQYIFEKDLPFEIKELEIENDNVKINIDFSNESKFKETLIEYNSWSGNDNIIDTFSNKFNVNPENIEFIESVSEYIGFISNLENINYVSRGQKNCKYELVPSLHRLHTSNYQSYTSLYESAFKQKVAFYDNSLEFKAAEELRAYGQHFGLPTNYLDFTEAHLISLLFAVEDYNDIENHSIVYFVDALAYNKFAIKDEIKLVDFSDKNLKDSKEKTYSDKSYFIKVGNSNERIHFQKGCFLKVEHGDSLNKMLESYTKVVIIDRNRKKTILSELFNLGITFENIYPDKDQMVKTIKFINNEI
ncbi:FRG domain-containing protein [Bacillus cereus]|uniref:FRG domain-containing protein n=1 Tax=unclassified Bacillus cereus group TaxID=2750818 RepID=UPI001F575109|nr:FRG domain-containing protein [Bacillus cereus group sp. TH243-1LC]MDA1564347.1 FRG domain-containing protein [Bacillus cereus group sp. TH243-1LC]MDA1926403.1 FRG domain-containing protein [Bacillus cereus]